MMALAGGLVSLLLGIIGIILWWGYFIEVLLGVVPAIFILGGALAAYLGFEEIRDKKATESVDTDRESLKQEVESLKDEIKELKGEKKPSEEGL